MVASNVGGIPIQIQDDHNGFLVEPDDIQGFADRIIHLLQHPRQAQQIGQNARETVREKFLVTRLLSDYLNLLKSSIS